MQNTTEDPTPRAPRGEPRDSHRADPRTYLDISFTPHGLSVLRTFRAKLSSRRGRPISLGIALDELLLTHPFALGREQTR